MNYFEYNGISSLDMGLRIESKNVFSAPEYEVDFLSIPGRDGELIAGPGRYPNAQVTYSVFLPAKSTQELAEKITAVKQWLYSEPDRYHQLSDTYDTDFYRKAVYSGKLDIEDELNRIGIFTISFSCLPYRYSVSGAATHTFDATSFYIRNPYAFTSKPYIRIIGSGAVTLNIHHNSMTYTWSIADLDEYLEIDSDLMNFYKGTELKNDTVVGDGFPVFAPGTNAIYTTGEVTAVEIAPRWVTL